MASDGPAAASDQRPDSAESIGNNNTDGRTCRVAVVGAGFAGLACAFELSQAGYDVTVFEARQRVGGRVQSLKDVVPGRVVEGGGELLGSNHPTVLAYARQFGLEFLDVSDYPGFRPQPVFLQGQLLTAIEVERIEAELESAYAALTEAARPVVIDEPWKTPNAEQLDRQSVGEWIAQQDLSPLAQHWLAVLLGGDNGVAVESQSLLGQLAQIAGGGHERYWSETEVFRCQGGNQQFATHLAQRIGDSRVKLGCPIREITKGANSMTVVTAEGIPHEVDDVVLAVPPSVWSKIRFDPPLPAALKPQMGRSVKWLSSIKRRFWETNRVMPYAMSDRDVSQTWDGTDGQADDSSPAILVTFSSGPGAEKLLQRVAKDRELELTRQLEELLPGFAENYISDRLMNWVHEPWTEAGYSFPRPGEVTTVTPLLVQGLGRLHFAGEHTCLKFVGYMEGALNSGVTLAAKLARRDGRS